MPETYAHLAEPVENLAELERILHESVDYWRKRSSSAESADERGRFLGKSEGCNWALSYVYELLHRAPPATAPGRDDNEGCCVSGVCDKHNAPNCAAADAHYELREQIAAELRLHLVWGFNGSQVRCECAAGGWLTRNQYAEHLAAVAAAA